MTDDVRLKKSGGSLHTGRMPCPTCRTPMAMPFSALFAGVPIVCNECGSSLRVDHARSREALEGLRHAQKIVDRAATSAGR